MKQWEAAYDDWLAGMKYKAIAEKYGVTESAVKSWASRYFKPKKKVVEGSKVATKKKKKSQPGKGELQPDEQRKRGAPQGNKNAVGNHGGAPPRNQNGFKHGLYAGVYWDTLDEEEKAMLEELPFDNEEEMLIEQIALLSVRERRLMRQIQKYSSVEKGQVLHSIFRSEDKRDFTGETAKDDEAEYKRLVQEKVESGERMPGHRYHVNTTTEATYNIIQRFEAELTRVQGKKTKCIEALNEIRKDRVPGDDGTEDRGVVVYLPDNGRGDS